MSHARCAVGEPDADGCRVATPTHAEYGIILIVGRGEFNGDEAVNMRAIAFSLMLRQGGGVNLDLVDADQTKFAAGLRNAFSEMSSVTEVQKNPDLELYHSIAIKVLSDEPCLKSFLMPFAEKMIKTHRPKTSLSPVDNYY